MSTVQGDVARQGTRATVDPPRDPELIGAARLDESGANGIRHETQATGGLVGGLELIGPARLNDTAGDATGQEIAPGLVSDPELIEAARLGDSSAFAELYRRHARAAVVVASHCARSRADIEDIVAEAFARILRLIKDGAGPTDFFRAYLFTTVRRLAERHRPVATDHDPSDEAVAHLVERSLAISGTEATLPERDLMRTAFESLPERWREVLWYVEVEDRTPSEIAPFFQLSPNGVAALSHRAREGLCQAYLQQHLSHATDAACQPIRAELGAYARGSLSQRARARVGAHLAGCAPCTNVLDEAKDINRSLRRALMPLVFGSAAPTLIEAIKQAAPGCLPSGPVSVTPNPVTPNPVAPSSVAPNSAAPGSAFPPASFAPAKSHIAPRSAAPALRPHSRLKSFLRGPVAATHQIVVGVGLTKLTALALGVVTATSGLVYAVASIEQIRRSGGPASSVQPNSVQSSQSNSPQTAPDVGGLVPVYTGHGRVSATEIGGLVNDCASASSDAVESRYAFDVDAATIAQHDGYRFSGLVQEVKGDFSSMSGRSCLAGSTAVTLELPADATVNYASLIWMVTNPGANWSKTALVGPDGQSHPLQAATTWILPDGATQAAADVTKTVAAAGAGAWHIDGVSRTPSQAGKNGQTDQGRQPGQPGQADHPAQAAAWSLVVAYTAPSIGKENTVVVYQGSAPARAGSSVNLSTPLSQAHADHLGIVSWGGPLDTAETPLWLVNSASSSGIAQRLRPTAQSNLLAPGGSGLSLVQANDIWFPQDPDGASATGLSVRPPQPAANAAGPLALAAVTTVG